MTTTPGTIATLKTVSTDIETAITAGKISEALALETIRHEKIQTLATIHEDQLTDDIKQELGRILVRIQDDIDVIEAAMRALTKATSKQVRRLNGYR